MADGRWLNESPQPFHRRECQTLYTLATVEPVMPRYLAAAAVALLVYKIRTWRARGGGDRGPRNGGEGGGDGGPRARHCEIRETGMKATGRPLTIDPVSRISQWRAREP